MQYPLELNIQPPERLSRLTSFFRLIMVIPQYIVLYFLQIAAAVVVFIAWWAILFTARYPQSLFKYMTWYMRWSTRVTLYLNLMTDKYPPFSGDSSTITPPTPTNTNVG